MPIALVALKITLVPLLIGAITLAGRRWGPSVAGWLSGLPVVAGPIMYFIAIENGAGFASNALVGMLLGVFAMLGCQFVVDPFFFKEFDPLTGWNHFFTVQHGNFFTLVHFTLF